MGHWVMERNSLSIRQVAYLSVLLLVRQLSEAERLICSFSSTECVFLILPCRCFSSQWFCPPPAVTHRARAARAFAPSHKARLNITHTQSGSACPLLRASWTIITLKFGFWSSVARPLLQRYFDVTYRNLRRSVFQHKVSARDALTDITCYYEVWD